MRYLLTPFLLIAMLIGLASVWLSLSGEEQAPSLSLRDIRGGEHSLRRYRGKVVVVNFWASWCPPCLVSLPAMNKLQGMLQRENINFEILAVSVDKDIEDAQYFIEDHPVDFILLSDTVGTVPALFNLKVMPTSFILDKNGTVIYKHEGFKVSDINIIAEKIRALSND